MVSHRVEGLRACAFGAPVCCALHQGRKAQGGGTGDCDWAQWPTCTFDHARSSVKRKCSRSTHSLRGAETASVGYWGSVPIGALVKHNSVFSDALVEREKY